MINVVESLLELARLVQGGRVGFSMLVMDENEDKTKALASANELVVKYTAKGPVIYIKQPDNMGGNLVPITSMDIEALHKILNKLVVVGKDSPRDEDMTDNTIWIKTIEENGNEYTSNTEVIKRFYDLVDKDKSEIVPYVQKIYRNGSEITVLPFIHEKQVYVKVKSDGEIEDLYTVLRRIIKNIDNNKKAFNSIALTIDKDIKIIKDKVADWLDKIGEATLEVPKMKIEIKQAIKNVIDSLNIDDIIPFMERKIRPKTFHTTGNATDVVLVKLKLKSDWDIGNLKNKTIEDINKFSGYYDFFNSPLMLEHGIYDKRKRWQQKDYSNLKEELDTQLDTLMSEMLVIGSYGTPMPKQYYYQKLPAPYKNEDTPRNAHDGYGTTHKSTNFTFIKRGTKPQAIFDVRRTVVGADTHATDAEFSYIVALKGDTDYTLWSRYIESIDIIQDNPSPISITKYERGEVVLFTPIGRQAYLNKPNNIQFVEQLYIAKEILLGNSYSISVEE